MDKAMSSAIATFSAKFINELESGKSVVSSPLSVEFLLGLLSLGSTEPAHQELLTSLGLNDDDAVRSSFASLSSKVMAVKGVTLNVANKVYIMQGQHELQADLRNDAVKVFDADLEKIDFSKGDEAASTINQWVESKTNNRIKDLLEGSSLNQYTRLVLVNALYFKGTWQKPFDPSSTYERDFHVREGQTKPVSMMYASEDFKYGESKDLGVKYLEMSYAGNESSMVVILPDEIEGLSGVLKKLASGYDLMGDLGKLYKTKVDVSLPKFKIETEIDLKELLPKIGINAIFSENHSGLTKFLVGDEELYVSKAVQKAFIEVNEEGAEAAAATGMVMMMRCAMMNPRFTANKPFLYILQTGDRVPLFLGTFHGNE